MAGPIKKSVTIAGHRTSVSLEPVFWTLLQQHADKKGASTSALIAEIDAERSGNLSSAIRTYLVVHLLRNGTI